MGWTANGGSLSFLSSKRSAISYQRRIFKAQIRPGASVGIPAFFADS